MYMREYMDNAGEKISAHTERLPEAADFVESTADYAVTGPYTSSDWNGTNAKTITVDLQLARTRRYSSSTVRLAATYWPDRWLAP